MKSKEPEGKLPDPSTWTTTPGGTKVVNPSPEPAKASDTDDNGAKQGSKRREQLEAAVTPRGSGSGGPSRVDARAIDFPRQPCEFKKWGRYDSLPIERACFVLLGFEPPPLAVLRFQQNDWNLTREPTYEVPPEYSDALDSLGVSIERGSVSALQISEYPYATRHVAWPELVRWAKARGFTVPPQVEAIAAKASLPLEPQAVPVVTESASGGVEPDKAGPGALNTRAMADSFAGLRWLGEQWIKKLGNKPVWLDACIVSRGARGEGMREWNPVCIGAYLVRMGHAKANSVRAKFQTLEALKPWLDEWKTYESVNFPAD